MESKRRSDRYFNPLRCTHESIPVNKLRSVTKEMLQKWGLSLEHHKGVRICDFCRKNETQRETTPESKTNGNISEGNVSSILSVSRESSSEIDNTVLQKASYSPLNEALFRIGEFTIAKKKIHQKKYAKEKLKKVQKCFKRLFPNSLTVIDLSDSNDDGDN